MKLKEMEEAEALAEEEIQQKQSKAMMWLLFTFWPLHILSYTSVMEMWLPTFNNMWRWVISVCRRKTAQGEEA